MPGQLGRRDPTGPGGPNLCITSHPATEGRRLENTSILLLGRPGELLIFSLFFKIEV